MNKLNYWRSDWLPGSLNRAKAMSGAMMLGGGAGGGLCGNIVIPPGGGVEKPMLGRYLLEGELGVARYQLACGRLPIQGDSIAQPMFKIAIEAHADVRTHEPQLPVCVAAVMNKALAKDPVDRYQDDGQMAKALLRCLQSLSAHGAPAATAAVGTGA